MILSRLFRARATDDHPFAPFLERFIPDGFPIPGASPADVERCEAAMGSSLPAPLRRLLEFRNGGSYNGGLLHLMGASRPLRHDDLAAWNRPELWKHRFETVDLTPYVFFADDLFGNQFGYIPGPEDPPVVRLEIQEGEVMELAGSMTEFFSTLLPEEGGWLLGADFREAYDEGMATRQVGQQLTLITPGLLGGSLAPDNLQPVEPWANLYVTGQIVSKIKPLPSGTEIRGLMVTPGSLEVKIGVR